MIRCDDDYNKEALDCSDQEKTLLCTLSVLCGMNVKQEERNLSKDESETKDGQNTKKVTGHFSDAPNALAKDRADILRL